MVNPDAKSVSNTNQGNAHNAAQQPWELCQDYLEATRTDIPAGANYNNYIYRHLRTADVAIDDQTSYHYGQRNFDLSSPPAIIYDLKPSVAWDYFNDTHGFRNTVGPKLDAQGSPMYERWAEPGKAPRQLRDLPILPDQISTKEHWACLEWVRRMDPRVTWHDMRRTGRLATVSLQVRAQKKREQDGMLSWHQSRPGDQKFARGHAKVVPAKLTPAHVAANTTRGPTPNSFDPVRVNVAAQLAASQSGPAPVNATVQQPSAETSGPSPKAKGHTKRELEIMEAVLILGGEPVVFPEAEHGQRIDWTKEHQTDIGSETVQPSGYNEGSEESEDTTMGPAYPKDLHDGACGCTYCQ